MTIEKLIEGILAREGGYVNDPRDAGGETNWGITVAVARANGFTGPMRSLTKAQARDIYFRLYVQKPGFNAVMPLSEAIAEEMVDTGVNMGPGKAAEFAQIALNGLNNGGKDYADIKEDGAFGPGSLRALTAFLSKRGKEGEEVFVKALNCLQGARYIELARLRSANEAFLYGWLRTRVS